MFEQVQRSGQQRRHRALAVSFAVHSAFLLGWFYRPAPKLIIPSEVALGTRGSAGSVIYLAPIGLESERSAEPLRLMQRIASVKKASSAKVVERQRETPNATAANDAAPDLNPRPAIASLLSVSRRAPKPGNGNIERRACGAGL